MNGAEILIKALENEGVNIIFGYPGGAALPVYDALVGSKIKHILTRHEQAAALAADGFARVTRKVGVCLATSGPGATNLVTGIANAFMDSVPVVAITGQVSTALMGTDAFQEVDIFGITLPIVKHSYVIRSVDEIQGVVQEAFRIAREGRPGPVLIDFPKDVAVAPGQWQEDGIVFCVAKRGPSEHPGLADALKLIAQSKKPLCYTGGGVRIAGAREALRAFVETTGIPTVSTLQSLGSLPASHELFMGMLGMHGTKAANAAVQNCDLLICVGARFDDRATGKLSEFAPHAKVLHLDADAAEVGKLRGVDAVLGGDLKESLALLNDHATCCREQIASWSGECSERKALTQWNYDAPFESVYAPRFLKILSETACENTYVACDVGQHQMWVAQHYKFHRPEQHLTSGGLGTMGYGLPAAIGAQFAFPDARVISVTGDGSIMMNIQELATINRYRLPIKIVLFDNQALGMVRQWQELFFEERYSEVDLSDNPDFVAVAEAFGIPGFRVDRASQVQDACERVVHTAGPLFVHVMIDPRANVWPLVPPGKSNATMMEGAHR